jgi:class 3 adenylate cyclase/tetratricopeptide (TPR) repeat protein
VTVVFADVTGSTAIGERLDPESLRRVMGRYFDEMSAVLERHGGTVEKFIGDAIMAVFGIPTLHEDDALRAIRAADEMRERLAGLNEELERDFGVGIQARIGINTGEVVTGEGAGQRLATGDAVNVAARLEQAAGPGEILLGEETRRLVRDAIDAERVEPLLLKGKAEPVPAWRLAQVRPGARGHERRLDSPLVGRRREFDLIRHAYERTVAERACVLFSVLGPAGVGKSRLVNELVTELGQSATVLSGRCLSYGQGITFWPLVEVFQQAGAERELEHALKATSPDETFWAIRSFFEGLTNERPLVLVFDDLHWAEPSLLDLLEHVADLSREAPILLICLARPEFLDNRPTWGGGKLNATTILLEPLGESESAELLENLLGGAELHAAMRSRVLEAAEGNPLFVEEMAAMLAEDGAGGMLDVPPTIQALLAARLDRLAQPEREVAGRASVEGKIFHRGAVVELSPEILQPDVATHLLALVRKELIRPSQADLSGEDAFRFRHQLMRDAAYGSLPKEARSELHERFSAWLERAAGERLAEYEEILGWHLEQAYRYQVELGPEDDRARELRRRAAERLATAGRRAYDRADNPTAARLLERAQKLFPEGSPERLELLPMIGESAMLAGELSRAGRILEKAQSEARATGNRRLELRALVGSIALRMIEEVNPVTSEVRRQVRSAAAELEELGDDSAVAKARHVEAMLDLREGQYGAMRESLESGLAHARRAGDRREEADLLGRLLLVEMFGPTPTSAAVRHCLEILEQGKANRLLEAEANNALGLLYAYQGRIDEARQASAERWKIYSELGMNLELAATAMVTGWIELLAGSPARAEPELRLACETLTAMGERAYLSTTLADLADVMYAQGRYEEAEDVSRQAEETTQPGDVASEVLWRLVRAKVTARRGEFEMAEQLAGEAVEWARRSDDIRTLADALVALGEVFSIAGSREEARLHLEEALALYEQKEIAPSAKRTRALLDEIATRPR